MNKLIGLKDYFSENNERNEDNQRMIKNGNMPEKILCDHCGRTANNGIRCLGICVSDNDY